MITTILALFASVALAGQPGGTLQQNTPPAPSAPTVAAPNPGAANPATTVTVTNGPLGRTGYVLQTPEGCHGLATAGAQQIRGATALELQAGAVRTLDACGRLATAQAGAIREMTLASAGASLVNPVSTTMTMPDGTVVVTAPAAGAVYDYARVDARQGVVTVASGPAATWAAASNGGQTYPVGLAWGGGGAWGAVASAQGAINAGIGQPMPVAIVPPAAPRPSSAKPAATRPANPPPAAPATNQTPPPAPRPPDPPEVTRARLGG